MEIRQKFEEGKLRAQMAYARAKVTVVEKAKAFGAWCNANRDIVIVAVPVIGTFAGAGIKMHTQKQRKRNIEAEKEVKELYVYDNRLGHYWKVKRPLTNRQWRLIEARKNLGEPLGEILEDLKLLD